jgi:hypothetical protein
MRPCGRVLSRLGAPAVRLVTLALAAAAVLTAAAALTTAPGLAAPLAARPRSPGPKRAWVAHVIYRTFARAAPAASARRRGLVPAVSRWGTPTTLLVLASRRGPEGALWLRVLLDRRPNGAAVWLAVDDTVLSLDRWRLRVSLAHRLVTVYRAGRPVRTFAAVVGKAATPTPVGLFAIAAELRQPEPDEFEGSWVLPLTAHSRVLRRFDGGDGQVALHGRGGASLLDPLGSARSHGCVRLTNTAIAWIARHVPSGTPVRVAG